MRIKLEKRQEPSKLMQVVTPIASVLLTMLVGVVVFDLLGIDGQRAVIDIFLTPLLASSKWQDGAVPGTTSQVSGPGVDSLTWGSGSLFLQAP